MDIRGRDNAALLDVQRKRLKERKYNFLHGKFVSYV